MAGFRPMFAILEHFGLSVFIDIASLSPRTFLAIRFVNFSCALLATEKEAW